jgi:hypothetical protein
MPLQPLAAEAPLPPEVEAQAKRILDGAARRLLAERMEREAKDAEPEGVRS